MKRLTALSLSCLLLAFALSGCSDDDTTAPSATGHLQLALVDAPVDFDDFVLEVLTVAVHRAEEDSLGGWYEVAADSALFHLLDLTNGVTAPLADAELPVGSYDKIRLILGAGNLVVIDGVEYELRVPSGMQSGLKINHDFEITEDEFYMATMDFDASRSIHITGHGTYMMRPVLRVQYEATAGVIHGMVDPASAVAVVMAVAGTDTITTFADVLSGAFRLMAVPEGLWDVTVTPTAGDWLEVVVEDVSVTAGAHTDLGTIVLELPE
jgi:hypothetical protein